MILEALGPRAASIVLDALGGGILFAVAWATVRVSYERAVGRPMPRNAATLALDFLAELANNLPGALNRAMQGAGSRLFASHDSAELALLRGRVAELSAAQIEHRAARPTLAPPEPVGPDESTAVGRRDGVRGAA